MAIKISQTEIWSDINQAFTLNAQGGIKRSINIESVFTSIDIILGTEQGERVMLPAFAANFGTILFDPINNDLASFATQSIKSTIEAWDPRVSVTNVTYNGNPDNNTVQISVTFTIVGLQQAYTITKLF